MSLLLASLLLGAMARAQHPGPPPSPPATREAVQAAIARGLDFLLGAQEASGCFGVPRSVMNFETFATIGTYESWTVATTGLVCMTLMEAGTSPAATAALDLGIDFLLANAFVKRVSDWDTDNTWGWIYGLHCLARALEHPHFEHDLRRARMREVGDGLLQRLARWQTPCGGWGYYDTEVGAIPPIWATSFMTAAAVVAMQDAKQAGFAVNATVLDKAVRAIEHARLKNGAFAYSIDAIPDPSGLEFINQVKGSLGRIQVCQLALYRAGRASQAELEIGIDRFFSEHRFLDVARKKPIPHEAYYANAAYFYLFGHFYAAQVIECLPQAARAELFAKLQRELLKTQEDDGAMWDFYISGYTRPYGTAFAVMALQRSLRVD
ncbi:MAG: hypothetical protein U1E76_15630 [Planctomycetota bacterium]